LFGGQLNHPAGVRTDGPRSVEPPKGRETGFRFVGPGAAVSDKPLLAAPLTCGAAADALFRRVKRDISELVNRVAFGGEHIVLTSRGNPKAVLIGLDDYAALGEPVRQDRTRRMARWMERAEKLAEEITERRGGEALDVESLLEANRRDLEDRDAGLLGR